MKGTECLFDGNSELVLRSVLILIDNLLDAICNCSSNLLEQSSKALTCQNSNGT